MDNEVIDDDDLQLYHLPNNFSGEIELQYSSDKSESNEEDNLSLALALLPEVNC